MRSLPDDQARDLAAMCDRILPSGPDGPGAAEADVLGYIDEQLSGPWGRGARMYREAPFYAPGDEGHGWQLAMTPVEAYSYGLTALASHVRERFGRRFAELSPDDQDKVIDALAAGEVGAFAELDGPAFFAMVRDNVAEGLFCDPSYGGNREMVGWRWLGYPGVAEAHGDYADEIDRHDEPYSREPRALDWRDAG